MRDPRQKSIKAGLIVLSLAVSRIECFSQHGLGNSFLSPSISLHRPLYMSATGMDVDVVSRMPTTTLKVPSTTTTTTTATEEATETLLKADTYRKGLITVAGITLLFASNSPALHAAYVQVTQAPPVLLLNAAASIVALAGVFLGGPLISQDSTTVTETTGSMTSKDSTSDLLSFLVGLDNDNVPLRAGLELGLWKFLGTTANMYGLSQTSADHGAFLIQLTTLFVPLAQGIMGVPIPPRIWSAIAMALGGVVLFTQDPTAGCPTTLQGDGLCALAAVFYATYDLRLFKWGKLVEPLALMQTKIATQTALSVASLIALGGLAPSMEFLSTASMHDLTLVGTVALWSGLLVNLVAPYLQVGGQQAVGPARAQIVYASQPLWAAVMSMVVLGETVGSSGLMGGAAFLGAMLLAATAEVPDADCKVKNCEV